MTCEDWDDDLDGDDGDDGDGEPLKLGMCCICLMEHPTVRNVVMLDKRSPQEGPGSWGCFQCGLPMAGAVAVLCDDCLTEYVEGRRPLAVVCVGEPGANQRAPFVSLTEPFEHDMSKHPEQVQPLETEPPAGGAVSNT